MKINCDAHVGADLLRGVGVVTRDNNGMVLFTGTKRFTAAWSVEVIELAAACYDLELACRFDINNVHFEGDSECDVYYC